ncbi:hypothetical protein V8G54_008751 [Vigna mungo]|uniref:Uncharacterized protein n=1 Tax=Vigna mungo TaxID=3915 RepID=A0AAQ3S6S5_VIGMU
MASKSLYNELDFDLNSEDELPLLLFPHNPLHAVVPLVEGSFTLLSLPKLDFANSLICFNHAPSGVPELLLLENLDLSPPEAVSLDSSLLPVPFCGNLFTKSLMHF